MLRGVPGRRRTAAHLAAGVLILMLSGVAGSGEPGPTSLPFREGERLAFAIRYGFVTAGVAVMQVESEAGYGGSDCFHFISEAHSTMPFSLFFEVQDRVESFVDMQTLLPFRYEKHLREGDFTADEVVTFDQERNAAEYPDGKVIVLPGKTQDVLSSLYYIRTMDLEVGRSIFIDNHADEKNYRLEVKVLRMEEVSVPAGTFTCYVLEPILQASGIFQHKGRLTVWLSADETRIPVMMKSKIIIGSINAVLTDVDLGQPQ
jgi:hypothetical protein